MVKPGFAPARAADSEPRGNGSRHDSVQALDRALLILSCVARRNSTRGIGLVDLSREVGFHKSTVYRLVSTLVKHGFVHQDPDTQRYRLGLAALELGGFFLAGIEVRHEATPFLNDLMMRVQETANLGILDECEVVYIDKVECPSAIRLYSRVGGRGPAHTSALGKAILAFSGEETVTRIIERGLFPRTPKTITDAESFRAELASVRLRGYAVDDEESREGIGSIGAPIFDHLGCPIAAISVTGLASRIITGRVAEIGSLVKDAAERASKRMGYCPSPRPTCSPSG